MLQRLRRSKPALTSDRRDDLLGVLSSKSFSCLVFELAPLLGVTVYSSNMPLQVILPYPLDFLRAVGTCSKRAIMMMFGMPN